VDTDTRLLAIEAGLTAMDARLDTGISDIKGHQARQVESLAELERTQKELKKMVLILCGYQAFTAASAAPSASTSSSTASRIVRFTTPTTAEGSSTSSAQSGQAGKYFFPIFSFVFNLTFQLFNVVRRQAGNLVSSAEAGLDRARRPD